MICPVCLNDVPEKSICEVCGAELEPDLNDDKEIVWLPVYQSEIEIQAEMVRAYLADSGIPVVIKSSVDTWLPVVSPKAVVRVYVPEHYSEEAEKLIKHFETNQSQEES